MISKIKKISWSIFIPAENNKNQFIKVTNITTAGFTVNCRLRTDVAGLLPTFSNVNGASIDVLITEK